MFPLMVLAHLLGDYPLQGGWLVRWKARSLAGLLVHGGIVTLTAIVCAVAIVPSWWPYALLIGLIHTIVDVVRARLLHVENPTGVLFWFLLDQLVHLFVIALVVALSGDPARTIPTYAAKLSFVGKPLTYTIGYILLAQPAWVLLRMVVRSVWGADAAPHLGQGDKYGPILERMLIATAVVFGQFALIILALLPRRLATFYIGGNGLGVMVQSADHWGETLLSTILAVSVGLILRTL